MRALLCAYANPTRWRDLHIKAELLVRQRTFDDDARERLSDYAVPSFTPNNFR